MATMKPGMDVTVVLAILLLGGGCGQNKFQKEVETEKVAVKLARHMAEGEYEVVYAYVQEDVGLAAGRLGLDLILHSLPDELRPEALRGKGFIGRGQYCRRLHALLTPYLGGRVDSQRRQWGSTVRAAGTRG